MTIGTPRRKATSEISHWASFSKPSPSTTIDGSPRPSGATERRIALKRSSDSPRAGERSGSPPSSRSATASHASGAKPSPVGIRTLSSSTLNCAVGAADDVEPREAGPHRHVDALHVGLVERAVLDQPRGHDAGLDDPPLAVGVAQEGVERAHALGEAAVERLPLVGGEHPRHGVDDERVRAGGP